MAGRPAYASVWLNDSYCPVIAVAGVADYDTFRGAIGSLPALAQVVSLLVSVVRSQWMKVAASSIAGSLSYESNMRGSADYRHDMAVVLCRRLLTKVLGGDQ